MKCSRNRESEMRTLYRQMAEKCDEYVALRNLPDEKAKAAELRMEILHLYAELAKSCGKAPDLAPDLFM